MWNQRCLPIPFFFFPFAIFLIGEMINRMLTLLLSGQKHERILPSFFPSLHVRRGWPIYGEDNGGGMYF